MKVLINGMKRISLHPVFTIMVSNEMVPVVNYLWGVQYWEGGSQKYHHSTRVLEVSTEYRSLISRSVISEVSVFVGCNPYATSTRDNKNETA